VTPIGIALGREAGKQGSRQGLLGGCRKGYIMTFVMIGHGAKFVIKMRRGQQRLMEKAAAPFRFPKRSSEA
jgi:hypothetical protein